MKVDLDDFIAATKKLHSRSVKRTRLQLKIRPHCRAEHRRRIFVAKVTDGKETYTTSVEHVQDLKRVEGLVADFVTRCTEDSVPPPPPASSGASPAPPQVQAPPQPSAKTEAHAQGKKGGGGGGGKGGKAGRK